MPLFRGRALRAAAPISRAEDILLNGQQYVDPVVRACATVTDHVLTDTFIGGIADRLYIQRIIAADRDRQFPGYRDEVNRQRAQHGLPPL